VFAPESQAEIYPPGFQTYVEPGPLAGPLCGEKRPGHFRGVCTVVAKLFALSRADVAFFGEKDYQQLAVIRRMAADLNLGTEAIGLWRALSEARRAFSSGERAPAEIEARARAELSGLRIDYCELRDPSQLERPSSADHATRLFVAAFAGKTRLIDNGALGEVG